MITTREVQAVVNKRILVVKSNESEIKDAWKQLKTVSEKYHIFPLYPKDAEINLPPQKIVADPMYTNLRKTNKDIWFDGANGFGDSFFQRIIIKHILKYRKTVYLHTPCPDIYWDLPRIKFVNEGHMWLRTQAKSAKRASNKIVKLPSNLERIDYRFCPVRTVKHCSMWIIRKKTDNKIEDMDFKFPVRPYWETKARKLMKKFNTKGKKLCIIRPPTNRAEWHYPTRNPRSEYYQLLIDTYKDEYFYLSIADLKKDVEWLTTRLKGIDVEFHHGELSMSMIFGLMKISKMMICYPAFFMLAGIAIRAKTFAIWGGCSSPYASIEESMGLGNFSYAAPDPNCNCFLPNHDCNKEISEEILLGNFDELKNRKTNGR